MEEAFPALKAVPVMYLGVTAEPSIVKALE
jgi:hypothetical protein